MLRTGRFVLGSLLACQFTASLCAQAGMLFLLEPQDPQGQGRQVHAREPGTEPEPWLRGTGRWFGARDWLDQRGIAFELQLINDASVVARGGIDPRATPFRSLLDATLTFDTEPLLGLRGGQLFADFQWQRGDNSSDDTGALQPSSNIDAEERTQLAALTYEQQLWDRALTLKVGKWSADADFAYVEYGFRFIHSSFGHSPTILGMPSYPDPSFGGALFVRPGAGTYAGIGAYDGAAQSGVKTGEHGASTLFGSPSDLFLIGEAGCQWDGELPGRAGIGAWRHTGDFARFDGGVDSGTSGFYFVMDQKLWAPPDAGESGRGIGCFLQYGCADRQVSTIGHHVGAALEWTGFCDCRPQDAIGLGASWASFSSAAGLQGSGELAVEAFYTLQITPWLSFKPDVQYIVNPGGLADIDDALVFTLRTQATF